MAKTEPTTPKKSFEWLGRPAAPPAPQPAPQPVPQVKREVEDPDDDDDHFDDFPPGAIRFTRAEVLARMAARRAAQSLVQAPAPVLDTDQFRADIRHASTPLPQATVEKTPTDFGGLAEQDAPEVDASSEASPPAPTLQDALPAGAPVTAEGSTVETAMLKTIQELIKAKNMEMNIKILNGEISLSVKTPEKRAAEPGTDGNGVTDSQLSTSSSVFAKPKRRLRVVDPSDDEDEDDEQELPETDPEEENDEEEQVTPKKKMMAPQELITPSPAKRLRTLDLNPRDSSDEEDDASQGIDDSIADANPFTDSWNDPEWVPDSQDMVENPSDFRIPKNAPRDPLDLKY